MNGKRDTSDASEAAGIIKHPDLAPPRKPYMDNVPYSEFVLWGYRVIENDDQSRQPMLMPIYRVISSDCPSTRLPITGPTIGDHQRGAVPSSSLSTPSSAISTPSSMPISAISVPLPASSSTPMHSPSLSRSSSISAFSSVNDDNCDDEKDKDQYHQRQKPTRQQYSPEVTRHLKQAFVDTVAQDRKLTKTLRRKIMLETGLNSRSLTYWFSNRKRRPPFLEQQYKEAVIQSRGQVKTYEDFELWWALSKKKN